MQFNIIDKIQVPTNIPAGEYVLSFRWAVVVVVLQAACLLSCL